MQKKFRCDSTRVLDICMVFGSLLLFFIFSLVYTWCFVLLFEQLNQYILHKNVFNCILKSNSANMLSTGNAF